MKYAWYMSVDLIHHAMHVTMQNGVPKVCVRNVYVNTRLIVLGSKNVVVRLTAYNNESYSS